MKNKKYIEQLRFKDLLKLFDELKQSYSTEEVMEMPIFIADYYSLHEIHRVFSCEKVGEEDEELIDSIFGEKCDGRAIIIY